MRRTSLGGLVALILTAFLSWGLHSRAVAQPAPEAPSCEDLVAQPGALGYRVRGRYCEGLYVQPVRSVLRLAALLGAAARAPGAGLLAVDIPAGLPAGPLRLRVASRDPSVPYQLDAAIAAGQFTWPARDVVEPVFGPRAALDAVAWINRGRPVFVPVALSGGAETRSGPTRATGPRAAIISTIPMEGYTARLVAETRQVSFAHEARLRPATTRLELQLPGSLRPGTYELWLTVRLLGSAIPEQQSWLMRLP